MIEELLIFLGIYVISFGLSNFLMSDRAGIAKPIAMRLFFIGVIFHELAHYFMCLAVGRIPRSISIKWKSENAEDKRNPRGKVFPADKFSFLQSVVVAFAPLYFGTWLIFWLWFGVISTPFYGPLIKTVASFALISILLTAAPSNGDLLFIRDAFRMDPKNSWYQIFLISISIMILWLFLIITQIIFLLDVFYYLAIAAIYLILKFSLLGIRMFFNRISAYNYKKPNKIHFRRLTRRRYRPAKPWKTKEQKGGK
jgi:hypothetical protein